jgi:hypothetical protein
MRCVAGKIAMDARRKPQGMALVLRKACNKADTLFYRNPQGRVFCSMTALLHLALQQVEL